MGTWLGPTASKSKNPPEEFSGLHAGQVWVVTPKQNPHSDEVPRTIKGFELQQTTNTVGAVTFKNTELFITYVQDGDPKLKKQKLSGFLKWIELQGALPHK